MELPKDLRFVPLKYGGRCRSCGTRLKVGERAHWSRSSKKVWCGDCAGGANSSVRAASDHGAGGTRNRVAGFARHSRSSSAQSADDDKHTAPVLPQQRIEPKLETCLIRNRTQFQIAY